MSTIIASRPKTATALRPRHVAPDTLSEITRKAAGLSHEELAQLAATISGWLAEPAAEPEVRSLPRGWLESRTKPGKDGKVLGPYYTRRWWGPSVGGKRKKYGVYLGKHPAADSKK